MRVSLKRDKDIKPLSVEVVNKGYIPFVSASYNLLAGEGGVGKSLVAIKSAIIYLLDHKDKNAWLFLTEDGINECTTRARNICSEMNISYDLVKDRIFWFTLEETELPKFATKIGGTKTKDDELIKGICEDAILNNIGFIVFDPLRAFHELEENSNDDMPFLTREIFPVIGKLTGATILVLHHSAKGEGSQVRGASSIGNDARISWVVAKVVEKNAMTGKRVIKEETADKIHLSVYKDNFGTARFCTIRDKDGMIDLPTARKYPVVVTEHNHTPKIDMGGFVA